MPYSKSVIGHLLTALSIPSDCQGGRKKAAYSNTKYKPHQGIKECQRRVRQGLARLNCNSFEDMK